MAISRRQFARWTRGALLAAAWPVKTHAFGDGISDSTPVGGIYSRDTFQPLVNSSFAFSLDSGQRQWLTLLTLEDMSGTATYSAAMAVPPKPVKVPAPQLTTFVLTFLSAGPILPQGTYEVQHPSVGRFSLFVVPAGNSLYAATFCLINNPAAQAQAPVRRK